MLINIFDDYQTARNACVAYQRCGKRHQGLRGVEYRVYFYNDVFNSHREHGIVREEDCPYCRRQYSQLLSLNFEICMVVL